MCLKRTALTGDCGIDAVVYHLGRPRSPEVWGLVRHDVASFIEEVSAVAPWQEAFKACQEAVGPDAEPPAPNEIEVASQPGASSSSVPLTVSEASSSNPPAPTPGDMTVREASSSPPPLPPPCEMPPSFEMPPRQVVGPASFREWIGGLSDVELAEITHSYKALKAAEDRWRKSLDKNVVVKEVKPRRKHSASKVHMRLAIGLAYLRWEAADGAGSKSRLKAQQSYRCVCGSARPPASPTR